MEQQRFFQLQSGHILDLSQVEYVSPVGGDPSWRRFEVQFRSGTRLEIYTDRRGMIGPIDREVFVKQLLTQANSPSESD